MTGMSTEIRKFFSSPSREGAYGSQVSRGVTRHGGDLPKLFELSLVRPNASMLKNGAPFGVEFRAGPSRRAVIDNGRVMAAIDHRGRKSRDSRLRRIREGSKGRRTRLSG